MEFGAILIRNKLKTIVLGTMAILVALGSYYYFSIYNSTKVISVHGTYKALNSFEDLEKQADIILIGSPIAGSEKTTEIKYPSGALQDIFTTIDFQVQKVIKKPSDLEISKMFQFNQPGGVVQTVSGKRKLEIEGYEDLTSKNTYVVYLGKNYLGSYNIMYSSNGHFNLNSDDSKADNDHQNFNIKKEVIKKYKKEN